MDWNDCPRWTGICSFVEAHERTLRIVRPLIDFQHVFHGGDKGRVGLNGFAEGSVRSW